MIDGVDLAEDGREAHDDGSEGRLDVLVGVVHQLLDARQAVVHDETLAVRRVQRLTEFLYLNERKSLYSLSICQRRSVYC